MDVKTSCTTSFAICFMEWRLKNPLVGVASQVHHIIIIFGVFQ